MEVWAELELHTAFTIPLEVKVGKGFMVKELDELELPPEFVEYVKEITPLG